MNLFLWGTQKLERPPAACRLQSHLAHRSRPIETGWSSPRYLEKRELRTNLKGVQEAEPMPSLVCQRGALPVWAATSREDVELEEDTVLDRVSVVAEG